MRDEFAVHLLNEVGKKKATDIAECFSLCLDRVELIVTPAASPRDLALVRTKLQEACFFAKRSMAVLKDDQESAK